MLEFFIGDSWEKLSVLTHCLPGLLYNDYDHTLLSIENERFLVMQEFG